MNACGFRWASALTLAALSCGLSLPVSAQAATASSPPAVVQAPPDLAGPGDALAPPPQASPSADAAASADASPKPGLLYVLALVAAGLAGASRRRA